MTNDQRHCVSRWSFVLRLSSTGLQLHLRAMAGEDFCLWVDIRLGRVDRNRRLAEADRDQIELDRRAGDIAGCEYARQASLKMRPNLDRAALTFHLQAPVLDRPGISLEPQKDQYRID